MPHVPGHNPGTGQDVVGTGGTYVPYKPPVQQLANIVSQSESGPTTEDQPGIVTINPNVVGDVFGGVDPNTIPYSQMNEAQKVFANFYGSSTPNLFQQQLQDFVSASPVNMQVYANSGLTGAGLNKFMTTFPESVANASLVGNIISGIQSGAGQAKDFVGGLFPGDSTDLQNLVDDFASIPDGLKKDAGTMLGINQDLQPGVNEVREELGVKKQTANDIVETAFSDETMEAMSAGDPVNFVGDTKGLFLTTPQGVIPATISNLSATQDPFLNPSLPFSEQTYPYYQQTLKKLGLTK